MTRYCDECGYYAELMKYCAWCGAKMKGRGSDVGDISKNFSRYEFACGCGCGFEAVDIELIKVNEEMRGDFGGKSVNIHSGCRCPHWNGHEGGTKGSRHCFGIAEDFHIEGVSTQEVYDYLDAKYPDRYGIGLYDSWVHLDVRKVKARW